MSAAVVPSHEAERLAPLGAGRMVDTRSAAATGTPLGDAPEAGATLIAPDCQAPDEPRFAIGFGVLFALLLGMAIYCGVQGSRFFSFDRWVAHTHTVIADIERTCFKMQTAESSMRGYVVTGNEADLPTYRAILLSMANCLQKIRAETGDNPVQQRNCSRLDDATKAKISTMEERSEQRRALGAAALDAKYISSRGQETMAKFLGIAQEMIGIENRLLERRTAERAALLRGTLVTLFVTSTIAAGLIVAGFLLTRRQWRRSQGLGSALARANAGLQREVADRRQAEEGLRASQARFTAFMDNTPALAYIKDEAGRMLYGNQTLLRRFGLRAEEWLGKTDLDLWPAAAAAIREHDRQVLTGDSAVEAKETVPLADGSLSHLLSYKFPLGEEGPGGGKLLAGMSIDVTARQLAEASLRTEREFLATLLDNLQAGVISCDAQGRLTHCNRAAIALHGLPSSGPLPPISLWPEYFDLLEADGLKPVGGDDNPLLRALLGEVMRDREFHVHPKSGGERTLSLNVTPLTDENGQRAGAVAVMHDVTAQRRARELALDSVHEKEILLQEVHHRVKNNLQIIGSLLTMQSRRTRSPAALEALSESVGRVRSIALVHEKLYGSANLQCVEAADYLRALSRNLYSALGSARIKQRESRVALDFDLEAGHQLDAAHAIACGLIVNEALTNSFKHAFPDNRSGRVTVALTRVHDGTELVAARPVLVDRAGAGSAARDFSPAEPEDGAPSPRCGLQLEVRDDGVGVAPLFFTPGGMAELTRKSLGMRLIRDLAKQVGGRFEFTPSDSVTGTGLTLRLNFSVGTAALAG